MRRLFAKPRFPFRGLGVVPDSGIAAFRAPSASARAFVRKVAILENTRALGARIPPDFFTALPGDFAAHKRRDL